MRSWLTMNACGLIVEYNPFHNGHLHHIEQARKASEAECIIAVMSGSFLQRGEPAIMDKFHRTLAALKSGVDIVVELPYTYAVESSHLFAAGSVKTLHEIGVSSICFGSESGDVTDFINSYHYFQQHKNAYRTTLKKALDQGKSYPSASKDAYQEIGLTTEAIDLTKPNNILGYSYVKAIKDNHLPVQPLTIKRTKSGYHDESISGTIASATSIRNEILTENQLTENVQHALPASTIHQLNAYYAKTSLWHTWENYFPLLHYRVQTMSAADLKNIHGVDEGLEYRIKTTAKHATSMHDWINAIKTKRYTWTRIQRMFVHLLVNTTKQTIQPITETQPIPYVRLLGMNETGQSYLNRVKSHMDVPLISSLQQHEGVIMKMEEKATHAYYSVLPAKIQQKLWKQEIQPVIRI